jgi:hypothetical protein
MGEPDNRYGNQRFFLVSLNRQRAIKVSVKPLHRGQQQQLEARFKGQA